MPDQFDIQRKLDHAAEDLLDSAMEKLEDAKEKARQHALAQQPSQASQPKEKQDEKPA